MNSWLDLQIGDRVRIAEGVPNDTYTGCVGVVEARWESTISVRIEIAGPRWNRQLPFVETVYKSYYTEWREGHGDAPFWLRRDIPIIHEEPELLDVLHVA